MGCSDSTAMQNHLHVRNQNVFTQDPRQYPKKGRSPSSTINEETPYGESKGYHTQSQLSKKVSGLGSEGFFQNSQQYLEQLYEFCEGNIQRFFSQLQEKISQIYMSISRDTLQQMNQNILINNESKIQISEEILWFNLNILKVASRKSQHKFNSSIFKQINKLQKNLVGYLKMKYPRGGQSFVPGDLMAVFKEFDLSEDIEFDIVKNADTYFGSDEDESLSREIKLFLNKLMTELDSCYPRFEKIMQEKVFVVMGQEGERKTLNYKIGRKIPQNVPKYTDLENNTLEINSPEIFRVLIKWMEYLEEILISPNENVNKKKNFKCFIEETQKGEKVFDEVNEDEYYDLINFELIEKIQKEKTVYFEENDALLQDMDRFNSHLIKLLDTSIRRQKFVPLREMETIKYSNLNAKFIAWVLGEKLMLALKKLIKIGKSFYNSKAMLNLDLIQFKVSDMMRSMVSGSKKEILAVYENLRKLQREGTIKIIKIKNRLGTSLNDAMIIFAMKDTFLICEIQLILADGQQKVNQKYKNIQLLNHFFYQLERSPYGILSEIAVLLAYKDSKVAYEDNITFEINEIDVKKCQSTHPKSLVEMKQQTKPFICTKCTRFYFKFENIFLMKYCQECNIFLCGKCIFESDRQLQKSIVNRQMANEIQRTVAKTLTKLRNISSSTGAASILQLFSTPYKKLEQIFGGKKVVVSKLIDYLNGKVKNNQDDLYFVIVSFRTGRAVFKELVYKPGWKEIHNPFNSREVFGDKKKLFFTSYDLILFYEQSILKPQNKASFESITENMLHLYISQEDLKKVYDQKSGLALTTLGIADFKLVVNIEKPVKKQTQVNQSYQKSEDKKNKCTKSFKYITLHEATAGLPDLAGAKSILKLKDMGIENGHLVFFREINWANTIKQLKLNKNNISSLAQVLEHCTNLQRLYVNENYITELVFVKQLPKIDIINAVNNEIKLIDGCANIRNISKLLLQGNKLQEFPRCEFPHLKILSLKCNPIRNFENVYNSAFPNIQQLYLHYEEKDENTYSRPNTEVDLNRVVLPFERLKSIQSESNFEEISILSKKIERVTLYRNGLRTINLASLQNLRFLLLSDNALENIDFLFSAKNNFQNNSIIEIDLSVNKIVSLPVMKSTSLIKANFGRNYIENMSNFSDSVLPNVQSLDFSQNSIVQMAKVNLPKVKRFNLAYNPLKDLASLQHSQLDSLEKLEFSNCTLLSAIPEVSLKSLNEISFVSTTIDNMQNLSKSLFPSLKTIIFNYCSLSKFPVLNIDSLQSLEITNCTFKNLINLEKSKLIGLKSLMLTYSQMEEVFQEDVLKTQVLENDKKVPQKQHLQKQEEFSCLFAFPQLQKLTLDGSHVKMSGLQNCNLPKLEQLSLQACHFEKYPKLRMQRLKTLNVSTCQLESLESMLTPQLVCLEKLIMDGNLMEKVNVTVRQLKVIDLSRNKLVEFTHMGELNQLEELKLDSNRLQRFPLLKAKNLKQLSINGNPLKDISQLSASMLSSLSELKITNCDLSLGAFPILKLQSVKSIYMMENQIKDISNLTLSKLPMVEDINLSNNTIEKVPVLRFPQLKFLRLNSNQISDISCLSQSECPELTIIELQTNNITSLPVLPFPNLTKVFMHENQCTDVSGFGQSSMIKSFSILNICSSSELSEFPILKCNFEQLYANNTKLNNVIRVNQYKGLIKLQLNGNGISFIPVLNLKELEMIQFQDNLLTDIEEFAKGDYHRCTQFSVKGNQITSVPMLKMDKLKKAYFNQNLIQDVSRFVESNLPQLQLFTIQNNRLRKVEKLPFPRLYDVYLTGNLELEEMACFNLAEYPNLFMIVAASTGIRKVQVLPKMPSLQKIWVSNSKLQDLDWFSKSLINLSKLSFLNVSSNKIRQVPGLRTSTLTNVYMTDNPIERMEKLIEEKRQVKEYSSWSISLKAKSDQEFDRVSQRVRTECPYIYLSRYEGVE